MPHQKPVPKKPRSQSASDERHEEAGDDGQAHQQRRATRGIGATRIGSHISMPRTKRTPPPRTIASGCHSPLSKMLAEVVEARADEAPAGVSSSASQSSSRLMPAAIPARISSRPPRLSGPRRATGRSE